jgi:general secretion pathway protein G
MQLGLPDPVRRIEPSQIASGWARGGKEDTVLKHLRSSEDFEQKNLLQKGFTLVELLVVIVILGILAAVVVFAVGGSTDDAKESACKSERSTVEAAIEAYRAKTGDYPADVAALTASGDDQFLRRAPSYYAITGTAGALVVTTEGTDKGCTT